MHEIETLVRFLSDEDFARVRGGLGQTTRWNDHPQAMTPARVILHAGNCGPTMAATGDALSGPSAGAVSGQ